MHGILLIPLHGCRLTLYKGGILIESEETEKLHELADTFDVKVVITGEYSLVLHIQNILLDIVY
jgi:hypothetical protein